MQRPLNKSIRHIKYKIAQTILFVMMLTAMIHRLLSFFVQKMLIADSVFYSKSKVNAYSPLFAPPGSSIDQCYYVFGTDGVGRDVFALLVEGTYTTIFLISIVIISSGLVSLIFGVILSYINPIWWKMNIFMWVTWIVFLFVTMFYSVYGGAMFWISLSSLFIFITLYLYYRNHNNPTGRILALPLQNTIWQMIISANSIPKLLTLLVLSEWMSGQTINFLIVLVLLILPDGVILFSSEIHKTRQQQYINVSKSLGNGDVFIFFYELLPNIKHTIYIWAAYASIQIVLLESSLSFIGLGLSFEQVSWGGIMSDFHHNPHAWWLIVFPTISIYALLWSLNILINRQENRY